MTTSPNEKVSTMMKAVMMLALMAPLGCGSMLRLSRPAPAYALGCAMDATTRYGYHIVAGGAHAGYARAFRPAGLLGDVKEVVSIAAADNSLVVTAVRYDGPFERGPSDDMRREVQEILDTCAPA